MSAETVENAGKLIVVSGPSGVGKGTILKALYGRPELRLERSVSATTRAPRRGERNGVDYHFLTREEFQRRRLAGEFLECFEVFPGGDWYGTLEAPVREAMARGLRVVLEIDVKGADEVRRRFPDAVSIFILPPNRETLRERLSGRGTESAEAFEKRLAQADGELESAGRYDYRIVNDRLDDAIAEFERVLQTTK